MVCLTQFSAGLSSNFLLILNRVILLVLAIFSLSVQAEVKTEPLPEGIDGSCLLEKITPRQLVEIVYKNVVATSSQTLDEMSEYVAPDVVFKDAVTSTEGWNDYRKVYEQFMTADQIFYKVIDWACSGRTVYMNWVFGMQNEHTSNQYVEFEGVSKLVLNKDDQLILNYDNWNEVPAGYTHALRVGNSGGLDLNSDENSSD